MNSQSGVTHHHAPVAARALEQVEGEAWREADDAGLFDVMELADRVCAEQHALVPLAPPSRDGRPRWADEEPGRWRSVEDFTATDRVALEFAVQFSLDVSSISDELRSGLLDALGKEAANFVAAVFVIDFLPRTYAALDALVDPGSGRPADQSAHQSPPSLSGIWDAFDGFIRAVPALDALDPVTSELVRLRGARQHQCRLCQSLRSRPALLAGADEQSFLAIDSYPDSHLSPAEKAALALTDAMIWTPGRIDRDVADAVGKHFSEAQRVELVLDVTRNAINKVAVALAADAPHVSDGIEIYDVDDAGDLVYGLSLD
jgi:alkylhydroperoxidase family enzyme